MTPQEIKWKDKIVLVTGIKSNNGVLHGHVARYIGQCGTVKREAKNGMLLVYFKNSKNAKHRAIPAGCLTLYTGARIAGLKLK